MKILRRLFTTVVLGTLVAAGGIVFSVRSQEQGMKAQLQTVFEAYRTVLTPVLEQINQVQTTAEERQMLDRARGFLAGTLSGNLSQDVQYITNLQQTVRALTVSLAGREDLAQNPALTQLKTETSLQGTAATVLMSFNEKVLAWNQRDRSTIGSWISSALHLEKVLMLNPDGRSEVLPTVTL